MSSQYKQQQLEWARERVFLAHNVQALSKPLFEGTQYSVPRSHLVKTGTEEEQVRYQLKLSRVQASETRKGSSSMPLPPWAFNDTKIVKAVNSLPEAQKHWLYYAYCEKQNWENESTVTKAVWAEIESEVSSLKQASIQKLKGLVYLCVQDYQHIVTKEKPLYTPAKIRELASVSESNWRRDWLPRWRRIQQALTDIDNTALGEVLKVTGRNAA